MHLRILSVVFAAVVLLLAGSCATESTAPQAEHLGMLKSARVYTVVMQREIEGEVIGYSQQNLGLVGMALADMETAKRYQMMEQQVAPVRARVRDLDFRRDFRDALRRTFKPHELPGAQNAGSVDDLIRKSNQRKADVVSALQASSQGQPVLIFWTSYRFEPIKYARLVVKTEIELYDANASTPYFATGVNYESIPVAGDQTFNGWSTAIKRWEESGGAAYRAVYREAITETMTMLRLMLADRPAPVREGKSVRELGGDKYREIFADKGRLHSLPRQLQYSTMQAQFPRPAAGSGRVYFYRAADGLPHFQPTIRVGNRVAGVLGRGSFFFVDAAPGEYEVSLQHARGGFIDDQNEGLAQRFGGLKFRVQAGETAYVHLFSKGGWLIGEHRIEQRQRAQAEPELTGLPPADGMYPEYVIRGRLLADKLIR